MASSTAPYDASMRLGMGFNSFTQELCLADVVKPAPISKPNVLEANAALPVDQQVHSTVKFISRFSELVEALGVSAASQIKHARGHYAAFLNVDNFNDHDVHYLIRVVASRSMPGPELSELDIIPNLPKEEFSKIYGDSFISGFNEGGEFVALISVKLGDSSPANIAAVKRQIEEQIDLTFHVGMPPPPEAVAWGWQQVRFLEGETKTVVQRRGGQISEAPSKWTLRDIREEVIGFAKHAFAHPVRLSPILTKYTTLRSFHVARMQYGFVVPEYEKHGANVYAEALRDAYMEYGHVAREIQNAQWGVAHGFKSFTVEPEIAEIAQSSAQASYETFERVPLQSKEEPIAEHHPEAPTRSPPPKWFHALSPYPPSIVGLSKALQDCRDEMIGILEELDAVTDEPELASTSSRFWEHRTPMLLKTLLPTVHDPREEQLEAQRGQAMEALIHESAELKQQIEEQKRGMDELKAGKNLVQEQADALERQVAPYDGWCPIPLNKPVRLNSVSSGKSVDYDYSTSQPSFILHQWDSQARNLNQQFEVVRGNSKGYFIRHCVSGRYLIAARSGAIGSGVIYMGFSDLPGSFTFEKVNNDDGIAMIHFAEQPEFTLNVDKHSHQNGASIIGWKGGKAVIDQWRFPDFT
ncbi:hypothetical protein C8F01DRAFT_1125383 [Mycena amicta]|nr:hypothetical protein C8F01DRAFT_1125383 [Mycena amicta]